MAHAVEHRGGGVGATGILEEGEILELGLPEGRELGAGCARDRGARSDMKAPGGFALS